MSGDAKRADFQAAWEASCLSRERWEGTTAIALTGVLVPLWIAFHAYLEPDLLQPFTAMRLAATAVGRGQPSPVRAAGRRP